MTALLPLFCAVCTDPTTETTSTLEPLGKGGSMVRVCNDCNGVHPRSGRYAFEGRPATKTGVGEGNKRGGKHRR
jgi:hypothetical protein